MVPSVLVCGSNVDVDWMAVIELIILSIIDTGFSVVPSFTLGKEKLSIYST